MRSPSCHTSFLESICVCVLCVGITETNPSLRGSWGIDDAPQICLPLSTDTWPENYRPIYSFPSAPPKMRMVNCCLYAVFMPKRYGIA